MATERVVHVDIVVKAPDDKEAIDKIIKILQRGVWITREEIYVENVETKPRTT